MKCKITLYLVILLLTSCTIVEKTGIEKRRYRSGYYLSAVSSQGNFHQRILENTADEKINKALKTGNPFSESPRNKDIALSSQEKQLAFHPAKAVAGVMQKVKPVIEKVKFARPSNELFRGHSAVCAAKKSADRRDWADGCIDILVEIGILIIAVIVLALFPGITPQGAELIATAILIVAGIVVLIFVADR